MKHINNDSMLIIHNIYQFLNIDSKSCLRQIQEKEIINMLFREFIQQNISTLEIPFNVDSKTRYPSKVWSALHKSMLATRLQNFDRNKTIEMFITSVLGGDDLGGITLDNVIDMWIENVLSNISQIVGSALLNPKINDIYMSLVKEHEIECSEIHDNDDEQIVNEGFEYHTHMIKYIDVNDNNRDDFNKLVTLILQSFDSETYGDLPMEYREVSPNDEIDKTIELFKELVGDEDKLKEYLLSKDNIDDDIDLSEFI